MLASFKWIREVAFVFVSLTYFYFVGFLLHLIPIYIALLIFIRAVTNRYDNKKTAAPVINASFIAPLLSN